VVVPQRTKIIGSLVSKVLLLGLLPDDVDDDDDDDDDGSSSSTTVAAAAVESNLLNESDKPFCGRVKLLLAIGRVLRTNEIGQVDTDTDDDGTIMFTKLLPVLLQVLLVRQRTT
jgi:hypothetical protein